MSGISHSSKRSRCFGISFREISDDQVEWNDDDSDCSRSFKFNGCKHNQKICKKYVDLYWNGITRELAEYVVKKYRTHRKTPEYVIRELNNINYFFKLFL